MAKLLSVKSSIFSLSLLFLINGCEIPHANREGEVVLCNVYNQEKREVILCPSFGQVEISLGNIDMSGDLTLKFLNTEQEDVVEYKNSILNIGPHQIADNNTSYIVITPLMAGSTKVLVNGGDINLSMTIIETTTVNY